jgi:hypothetical protein
MAYGFEDQEYYYDPNTGEFVSAPVVSGIGAPEVAYVAPQPVAQPSAPALTPEFIQQLQQGAAAVGNAAQSGGISALFAPGTLSQFDPLYDYAKTAPILSLKGNTEYENLNFQALPGTNYRLTVGGNVVGSASTPQEVARLVNQANAISEQGGKAVDVRLQKEVQAATRTGEPITAFEDVYANRPNDNGFLDIAIPAALAVMGGAALGPLLGGTTAAGKVGLLGASKLAGAAGAGLGSAAGSFAGSMGTGANLEEALIKAGISGLTAGVLKGVMPSGVGDAAAGKTAAIAPGYDIAVAPAVPGLGGTTLALPAFSSPFTGVGAGLVTQALPAGTKINEFGALVDSTTGAPTGSLGFSLDLPYIDDVLASMPNFGAAAPLASAASSVPGDLVVTGLRTGASALPAVASALPAVANIVGAQEVLGNQPTTPREETTVTGNRIYDQAPTGPLAAIADAVAAAAQPAPPTEDEIVVSNTATPRVDLSGLGGLVPSLIPTPPPAPAVEILPGEELIDVAARRIPETRLDAGLSAAAGSLFPAASADVSLPGEELIDVAAKRLPETRLDSGLAAAAGALTPAAQPVAEVVPGEIVVTSTPTRPGEISSGISALTPEVISNIVSATESLGYAPSTVEEEILAEGRRYERPSIASALAVPVSQTYPIAEGATDVLPDDETLVEGRRIQPPPIDAALVGLPVAAAVAAPAVLSGGAAPQGPLGTSTPSAVETGAAGTGGLTAKQVINGITAANAVGALISDALAGGGGGGGPLDVGTGYTVPTGRARQLAAATFDPFTYGQREGEFAFFGDGMAEGGEVEDDMVKHLVEYRKGCGHMGPGRVKGIGSGQEDKIPAWLSDGEYVWSAQDVADLGDGSTDEGVRRLDRMRKMVRQRAGRKDVKKIAKPQCGIEDMLKAVGGAV